MLPAKLSFGGNYVIRHNSSQKKKAKKESLITPNSVEVEVDSFISIFYKSTLHKNIENWCLFGYFMYMIIWYTLDILSRKNPQVSNGGCVEVTQEINLWRKILQFRGRHVRSLRCDYSQHSHFWWMKGFSCFRSLRFRQFSWSWSSRLGWTGFFALTHPFFDERDLGSN